MSTRKDITGQKFNRLTAIEDVGHTKQRNRIWLFSCDCGNTHRATVNAVSKGNTKSCGCQKRESTSRRMKTHGLSTAPDTAKAYNAWLDIHRKCYNRESVEYVRYGAKGRGIQDSWFSDPVSFCSYVLALPGFDMSKSIDRIINERGYEEGNLRWATPRQQARNRAAYSTNSSGKTGVEVRVVDDNTYCTAHWFDQHTLKSKSKNFSVRKLGLLPAFALAAAYRDKMIALLNEQGAGYSETHGNKL